MEQNNSIRLTGLWRNTDKNGRSYLSGVIGGARVQIYENDRQREGSNDPDFYLNIVKNESKDIWKTKSSESKKVETPDNEDIPF